MKTNEKVISQFGVDVLKGFSSRPRVLSSRYFYDEAGDKIFQEIMNMPDYYLSRSEYEIINEHKEEILKTFSPNGEPFNLVEFGAGDGFKTKVLLKHFVKAGVEFTYYPVDISAHILEELKNDLNRNFPGLEVEPLNMDYFNALVQLKVLSNRKTATLFLGSNIGNFTLKELKNFIEEFHTLGHKDDLLYLGVDLRKDPEVILRAYSDPAGITARFNLNLLTRMNKELGGNIKLDNWKHYALYDPISGEARSYLISLKDQEICFNEMEACIRFGKSECIHTEISRKYSLLELRHLAENNNFTIVQNFTDSKGYFVNSVWAI